jgi:hypothetical protein
MYVFFENKITFSHTMRRMGKNKIFLQVNSSEELRYKLRQTSNFCLSLVLQCAYVRKNNLYLRNTSERKRERVV